MTIPGEQAESGEADGSGGKDGGDGSADGSGGKGGGDGSADGSGGKQSCDKREIIISRTTSSDGWDGYVNMQHGLDTKNFVSTYTALINAYGKQSEMQTSNCR